MKMLIWMWFCQLEIWKQGKSVIRPLILFEADVGVRNRFIYVGPGMLYFQKSFPRNENSRRSGLVPQPLFHSVESQDCFEWSYGFCSCGGGWDRRPWRDEASRKYHLTSASVLDALGFWIWAGAGAGASAASGERTASRSLSASVNWTETRRVYLHPSSPRQGTAIVIMSLARSQFGTLFLFPFRRSLIKLTIRYANSRTIH